MANTPAPRSVTWANTSTRRHTDDTGPLGILNQLAMHRLTLTVPSTLIDPASPPVALSMDELRERVTYPGVDTDTKDRVWRHLGQRARTERGDWNLFALGMAHHGLRSLAFKRTKDMPSWWAREFHFLLAAEFLFALHRLRLNRPNVFSRLVGAAYDQASGRKRGPEPVLIDPGTIALDTFGLDIVGLHAVTDHTAPDPTANSSSADPYTVLERLVTQTRDAAAAQRLTPLHATLISRTYLDGETLRVVAAELGLSESNASKQRRRAATLIAHHLGRDDATPDAAAPDPASSNPASSNVGTGTPLSSARRVRSRQTGNGRIDVEGFTGQP